MKFLLLSASTGNGHMAAAFALERELRGRGHDARSVDVLDFTGKGFRAWYRGGYETLVRRSPKTWGRLYKASDRPLLAYHVQTALDTVFVERMRAVLDEVRPDWVVCTHSLPQPSLARWRKRSPFRFAVVVTDLYPQRMWLRGRPDFAFVPTEWSKQVLLRREPRFASACDVVGIPVDAAFRPASDPGAVRGALGLEPASRTVLVTAGGIGGGPIAAALEELGRAGTGAQVAAVCGRNADAFQQAQEVAARSASPVFPYAHVDTPTMAALLQASDMIVAKPGGLTTFEALATGTPFVVYQPFLIPGQEERNARYLAECGAGVVVRRRDGLGPTVAGLYAEEAALPAMRQAALREARPDSARLVCERLEALASDRAMVFGDPD